MRPRFIPIIVAILTVAGIMPQPTAAGDAGRSKTGSALREMGKDFKHFGKKVGEAGRQAGHEIAGAARKVWYRGREVSLPMLHDVQTSTREFWRNVMEGKDRTLAELRRENAALKRRFAEKDGEDE